MEAAKFDLLQGALDLLILKTLALEPLHGYGIAQRILASSREVLQVQQGSLYPALHRFERNGMVSAEWKESGNGRRTKFYSLGPRAGGHRLLRGYAGCDRWLALHRQGASRDESAGRPIADGRAKDPGCGCVSRNADSRVARVARGADRGAASELIKERESRCVPRAGLATAQPFEVARNSIGHRDHASHAGRRAFNVDRQVAPRRRNVSRDFIERPTFRRMITLAKPGSRHPRSAFVPEVFTLPRRRERNQQQQPDPTYHSTPLDRSSICNCSQL